MGRNKVKRQVEREVVRRTYRHAPPWLILAVLPLFGALARWVARSGETGTAMLTAIGLTAGVGGLVTFTWHVFKPRGASLRWHATGSVAAAGLWVMWVAVAGLFRTPDVSGWKFWAWIAQVWYWPVWAVWLLAGCLAALMWNIRAAARGDGTDAHDGDDGGLMGLVGVAGRLRPAQLEANGNRVRATVQTIPGESTADDVVNSAAALAGVLGVGKTRVRTERDPDNHSRADYVITPRDLLKVSPTWPGPSAPGESIAEPIPLGLYEGGDTAKLWFPGTPKFEREPGVIVPRTGLHLGTQGMTGAGKSEGVVWALVDGMTREGVSIVYSDPVKGLQTIGELGAGVALLLTDRKTQAVPAFRRLTMVIAARTHAMGQAGFTQWTPEVFRKIGLKYLIYVLEEAADLIANSELFVKVTEQARSAGISLVVSMQRMSHDRMETSARYNLGGSWCFGTGDARSAEFVLSPQTIEAGAAPEEWKADHPGKAYLEAPGVPEKLWSEPMRTWEPDRERALDALAEHASGDPWLDPITEAAFGKVATDYRRAILAGDLPWANITSTRTNIWIAGTTPADPPRRIQETKEEPVDDDDDVDQDLDEDDDVDLPPLPANPEPGFMDEIDTELEIEEGEPDPPLRFAPPPGTPRATATAARRLLREEITKRLAAGQEIVTTRELVDFRRLVNRSKAWLTGALAELVDEGWLEPAPDRGAYELVPADERGSRADPDIDALADALEDPPEGGPAPVPT